MGITNLKVGLSRKFAGWTGERIQLEMQIAEIDAEYVHAGDKPGHWIVGGVPMRAV